MTLTRTLKRRAAALALAALALAAIAAPATSAREALVHAHIASDGSTVVSGYDGGVALATK